MNWDAAITVEPAWLLAPAGGGLVMVFLVLWRLLRAIAHSHEAELLSDGAVLVVSDGRVQQASPEAVVLFGRCSGQPVSALLEGLLGGDAAPAVDAVARLELTGEPIDLLVRTGDGRAWKLIGAPAGALIRLVLREARDLDERLREAEARTRSAEAALHAQGAETDALRALVAEGPIIAWRRTAEGTVTWSGGCIRTRSGAVNPEQAVELVVARKRLNRQPTVAGEPQKSRVEIVVGEGAETVSLHVTEIVRSDGSRVGFATDAGSAAAAERTLTRFVQTMTETFAHLTVGLAIFDRNQTLALFNPALVQMWQVEPAWLARRPSLRDILDELRTIRRLPELEDFHQWRTRLLGLFENTEAADYEELWHLADGSNIRVLARPHPHGALAFTFDDVTERMRLEQRYRHSIDLRRATLDGLTEGIAVFGANGLLQFVNQAFHEIWGTDGDTVYAAMHARQLIGICEEIAARPEVWQKLHGFITGEESRRAWTARLRTGAGRELTARFAPLPDGSTLTVFSDITEAERISEALLDGDAALDMAEAARAALDALIADEAVSALDEIDQSLAALRDCAPGALDTAAEAGEAASARLRAALSTAAAIAARPLAPRAERNNPTCIAAALHAAAATAAPRAFAAGVTLTVDAGASGDAALGAGRLRQLAFRLAADALARSTPGAAVTLGGSGSGARFEIWAEVAADGQAHGQQGQSPSDKLLARLADRDGGRVEVRPSSPDTPARLTCRFEPQRRDLAGAAGSAGRGTVHALGHRAG